MLLHGRKITIVVQQGVVVLDAESADDNVGRLADRDAQSSQGAVITGGADGEIRAQEMHEGISTQCMFNTHGMFLIAGALKDLEQNEVANQQRLATCCGLKFGGRRCSMALQMCDPYGAIDEDHGWRDRRPWGRPWRILSRSPSHPNPLISAKARACS